MAVDHFRDNFHKGGFVDKGLQEWDTTKRQQAGGKGAGGKYPPLLSRRKELYNSITFSTNGMSVTISSDKPYAEIHNEGGNIDVTVTDKMKRFGWAMHFKQPKKKQKEGTMWKSIALKKEGSKMKIKIPQRRFIGESHALTEKIKKRIDKDFNDILKKA